MCIIRRPSPSMRVQTGTSPLSTLPVDHQAVAGASVTLDVVVQRTLAHELALGCYGCQSSAALLRSAAVRARSGSQGGTHKWANPAQSTVSRYDRSQHSHLCTVSHAPCEKCETKAGGSKASVASDKALRRCDTDTEPRADGAAQQRQRHGSAHGSSRVRAAEHQVSSSLCHRLGGH